MKESSLFPTIKKWLEDQGYKVYAEVPFKGTTRYIDVVGLNHELKKSISIELKTSHNKNVKLQAQFNSNNFEYSFIAVPKPSKKVEISVSPFFGLLYVDIKNSTVEIVHAPYQTTAFKPSFNQLLERLFLNSINEEIFGGIEISKEGATAYQNSIKNILNYLKNHGPCSLEDLAKNVDTHWTDKENSLRQCLKQLQKSGQIIIHEKQKPFLYSLFT